MMVKKRHIHLNFFSSKIMPKSIPLGVVRDMAISWIYFPFVIFYVVISCMFCKNNLQATIRVRIEEFKTSVSI